MRISAKKFTPFDFRAMSFVRFGLHWLLLIFIWFTRIIDCLDFSRHTAKKCIRLPTFAVYKEVSVKLAEENKMSGLQKQMLKCNLRGKVPSGLPPMPPRGVPSGR